MIRKFRHKNMCTRETGARSRVGPCTKSSVESRVGLIVESSVKSNIKSGIKSVANAGFTILEMLFVIGIFAILTSVVIFNYGNFNNNIIMTNLAYEVALEIRQAQVYSLGVRAAGIQGGPFSGIRADFDTKYGVFFNLDVAEGNTNFVSFADFHPPFILGEGESTNPDDVAGNNWCDAGAGLDESCPTSNCLPDSECRQIAKLIRGISFAEICVSTEGVEPINSNGTCAGESVEQMAVTFERPYTDAIIKTSRDDNVEKRNAAIILQSTGGSKRAIIVRHTGQISVDFINNN